MKKRKVIFGVSLFLFLIMNETIFDFSYLSDTVIANAEETNLIKQGDYTYKLNEDGTASIQKYKGSEPHVVTPDQVVYGDNIYKVTKIDDWAFAFGGIDRSLRSIKISEGIESIGECAFIQCTRLNSVDMADTVKTIGKYAFKESIVSSIKLSKELISIGDNAFELCSLKSISIPDSVREIGSAAFTGTFIEELKFPKSINNLSMTTIGYCRNLKHIEVDKDNENYESIDGVIYSKDLSEIILVSPDVKGEVKIPDSIKSIRDCMFYDCEDITSVILPQDLESIGNYMFRGCKNLTNIVLPENLKSIGEGAFKFTGITNITLPQSLNYIGEECFECSKLEQINIPENIKNIYKRTFYGCNLSYIYIPKGIEKIYESAFGNGELKIVEIENGDIKIDSKAFKWCSKIQNIRFKNCSERDFKLDDTIEDRYDKATITGNNYSEVQFYKAGGNLILDENSMGDLNNINIIYERKTVQYEDYEMELNQLDSTAKIIKYKGNDSEVNIPGYIKVDDKEYTVTTLGTDSFRCSEVVSVKLPNTIIEIGKCAYYGCKKLKSIDIQDGVRHIFREAFAGTKELVEVRLPKGLEYISERLFAQSGISKIEIPMGVTEIVKNAFIWCDNLKEVELPESVSNIEYDAFYVDNIRFKNVTRDLIDSKEKMKVEGYYKVILISDNYNEIQFVKKDGGKLIYDSDKYDLYDKDNCLFEEKIEDNSSYEMVDRFKVCDINEDDCVDMTDLSIEALNYNKVNQDEEWNSKMDLNRDNICDIYDLVKISSYINN